MNFFVKILVRFIFSFSMQYIAFSLWTDNNKKDNVLIGLLLGTAATITSLLCEVFL